MRFVLCGNHGGKGYAPLAEHVAGELNHLGRPISHRYDGGRKAVGGARFLLLNRRELRHVHDSAS